MASTITPVHLSGSTDGNPIKVAATAIGSGTTIHTAVSGTTSFDEVTLFVTNTDTSDRTLTVGWAGRWPPPSRRAWRRATRRGGG